MELKNGKTYLIDHSRKGTFAMKVAEQDDEWVSGVVAGGKVAVMNQKNEYFVGDDITVRACFIQSAVEQPA